MTFAWVPLTRKCLREKLFALQNSLHLGFFHLVVVSSGDEVSNLSQDDFLLIGLVLVQQGTDVLEELSIC